MAQYDQETREVYEATAEAMAESIRLFIVVAAIAAEAIAEARADRHRREREASEERARQDAERARAERAAAEPLLRAAHQERFWADPDPRRIGLSWQAASEWAAADPYAQFTLDHMREQLRIRFGVEVPEWEIGGAGLARLVTLADRDFQATMDQARESASTLDQVSYAVLIRDREDPYTILYRGETSAPVGRTPQAVAAEQFQVWAAGVEGAGENAGRYDVEVVENTGEARAGQVPAAQLRGHRAAEALEAEAARVRAILAEEEPATAQERLYALSAHLDEMQRDEWQRVDRREALRAQLAEDLPEPDRSRLQKRLEAVEEGISTLRQEQADTALSMAATAAEIRGENPTHVYDAARLTDSLDEGWWRTANSQEIAGVWEHVGQWEEGQARTEMQRRLRARMEQYHGVSVPEGATPEVVAALYGGEGQPGPAVALSEQGDVLRAQAQAVFEESFEELSRAVRLEAEAERQSGAYAEQLRTEAAMLTERAALDRKRGVLLLDQGTWLDRQAPGALQVMHEENDAQAVTQLLEEFERRWGRPVAPETAPQAAEAVSDRARTVTVIQDTVRQRTEVTVTAGSADPAAVSVPAPTGPAVDAERTAARQEKAAAVLASMEDREAAEAVQLAAQGFPEPAEAAVARPAASKPSSAPGIGAARERSETLER